MDKSEIRAVLQRVPRRRTVYRYFPDRYAFQLLRYCAESRATVAEIKRSRFARLLQKPEVRAQIDGLPKGRIEPGVLDGYWPREHRAYRLSLGLWGGEFDWQYEQVSRPGYNLVLQLNFAASHVRKYEHWIRPAGRHPFNFEGHPTAEASGLHTLAWARLDIDLESGTALIEEIQQDWLRRAVRIHDFVARARDDRDRRKRLDYWVNERVRPGDLARYVQSLAPYQAVWAEATLSAALWFLAEVLGIEDVWYHTHEGGQRLKRANPPRSVYSRLPRNFCFERTRELPPLLARHPHRPTRRFLHRGEIEWYRWSR